MNLHLLGQMRVLHLIHSLTSHFIPATLLDITNLLYSLLLSSPSIHLAPHAPLEYRMFEVNSHSSIQYSFSINLRYLPLQINNKEEAAVRCRINHFSSNPSDRLLNQSHFWELPSDPLFADQVALLEELNRMNKRARSTVEEEEEEE